jgi:formylglycine-generating enzyme required for sulfatase activity
VDGACECVPESRTGCSGGDVWWYDSCGTIGGFVQDCDDQNACTTDACLLGACVATPVKDGTECGTARWCQAGACVCKPDCTGKTCGDDGCGGSCGACATGLECGAGFCRTPLVAVPAGVFSMGCNAAVDDKCQPDEKPYHDVGLAAFWIEQWKVSVTAYRAYLDAAGTGCRNPGDQGSCLPSTGAACTWGVTGKELHPINCVTWYQADGYCRWAGRRLCTEAEWERAARGTTGLRFPWGNDCPATWGGNCAAADWTVAGAKANCLKSYCKDEFVATSAFGALPGAVSASGALELVGNVSEWVADWYGSDYYCAGAAADTVDPWSYCAAGAPPPSSPWVGPTGPAKGEVRVRRGAGYSGLPGSLRTAFRGFDAPSNHSDDIGFRCCKP